MVASAKSIFVSDTEGFADGPIELIRPFQQCFTESSQSMLELLASWEAVVIAPSAKFHGRIQAQFFNQGGFLNDCQYPDLSSAIEALRDAGFSQPANGLLQKCMERWSLVT